MSENEPQPFLGLGGMKRVPPETMVEEGQENMWSVPDHSIYKVRQPGYNTTYKKAPSGTSIYKTFGCDFVRNEESIVKEVGEIVDFSMIDLPDSKDLPSIIIVNAQIPLGGVSMNPFATKKPDPGISKIMYSVMDPEIAKTIGTEDELPQLKALRRLVALEKSSTSLAFKVIGRVDESEIAHLPNILQRINGKPARVTESAKLIIGKLPSGHTYLEVDYDIRKWSLIARTCLDAAIQRALTMKLHLGYLVEGACEEELPEQLLCTITLLQLNKDNTHLINETQLHKP